MPRRDCQDKRSLSVTRVAVANRPSSIGYLKAAQGQPEAHFLRQIAVALQRWAVQIFASGQLSGRGWRQTRSSKTHRLGSTCSDEREALWQSEKRALLSLRLLCHKPHLLEVFRRIVARAHLPDGHSFRTQRRHTHRLDALYKRRPSHKWNSVSHPKANAIHPHCMSIWATSSFDRCFASR